MLIYLGGCTLNTQYSTKKTGEIAQFLQIIWYYGCVFLMFRLPGKFGVKKVGLDEFGLGEFLEIVCPEGLEFRSKRWNFQPVLGDHELVLPKNTGQMVQKSDDHQSLCMKSFQKHGDILNINWL